MRSGIVDMARSGPKRKSRFAQATVGLRGTPAAFDEANRSDEICFAAAKRYDAVSALLPFNSAAIRVFIGLDRKRYPLLTLTE